MEQQKTPIWVINAFKLSGQNGTYRHSLPVTMKIKKGFQE
jgi:hypothetical protein